MHILKYYYEHVIHQSSDDTNIWFLVHYEIKILSQTISKHECFNLIFNKS